MFNLILDQCDRDHDHLSLSPLNLTSREYINQEPSCWYKLSGGHAPNVVLLFTPYVGLSNCRSVMIRSLNLYYTHNYRTGFYRHFDSFSRIRWIKNSWGNATHPCTFFQQLEYSCFNCQVMPHNVHSVSEATGRVTRIFSISKGIVRICSYIDKHRW